MFDKRALNNEIFPLKSKIGRAKVHLINALSKKIKKIKILLERSPDNAKLKVRHDAAVEQIHALKKINLREAAKTAIVDLSNPLETLKSTTTSLDERTLAKLYSHEFVVSAVKEIKIKHNLNDENDKWRDFIKDIGAHKKKRKEDQKKKLKEIKKNKKVKSKELKKTNPHKEKKPKWNDSENPTKKKIPLEQNAETPTSDIESETNDKDEGGNADLFFVTQNGENYQSTVKNNVSKNSDDEIHEERAAPNEIMNQNQFKHRHDDKSKRSFTKKPYKNDRFPNKNFNQKRFSSADGQNDETEQLHPSWAAKKKQKIVNFQGTKINFDGDTPQIVRSKSFNVQPVKDDDKTLHPSWAAKMKQKTLVKEFKGQKIKFED